MIALSAPLTKEFNFAVVKAKSQLLDPVFAEFRPLVQTCLDHTATILMESLVPPLEKDANRTVDFIIPHSISGDDDSLGPVENGTHKFLRGKILEFLTEKHADELKASDADPAVIAKAMEVDIWNHIRRIKKDEKSTDPNAWGEIMSPMNLRYLVLNFRVHDEKREEAILATRNRTLGFVHTTAPRSAPAPR